MKKVLFVCTGNTCRSPMAEAIFRNITEQMELNVLVESAGVAAIPGLPISANAVRALQEKSIHHFAISKSLTQEVIESSDLILTMTDAHKRRVQMLAPESVGKLYTLKEYGVFDQMGAVADRDVQDPFGGDLSVYRETASELDFWIRLAIDRIKKDGQA